MSNESSPGPGEQPDDDPFTGRRPHQGGTSPPGGFGGAADRHRGPARPTAVNGSPGRASTRSGTGRGPTGRSGLGLTRGTGARSRWARADGGDRHPSGGREPGDGGNARGGSGGIDGGPGSGAWMGYGHPPGRPGDGTPPGGDPLGGPSGGGGVYGSPDPLAGMPPLAPSGRRVLARIIDIVIVGVVVWLVSLALGVAAYQINNRMQFGRSFGESLITGVLYVAYDAVLIYRGGQTVGKRLLKLRVANLSDGSTPTFQTSLARSAVLWVPFAFCCAFVWTAITGGWSFFDRPYKQGLHDKAAKTVVVSIV